MINFGIDLGTTNSAIAKFEAGKVSIFRNPVTHRDTLPSVVAFRKGRIIVGEKAREYVLKAPEEVAAGFKRKMGTTESFHLADQRVTPTALSAYVLKELKTFVHTGEVPQAAVITIPASFDTIQSNATKQAGYEAGFEEVVLLQEPIAASLAYANQQQDAQLVEGQWLVYDLGGGTFDVALVRISDGEMQVLDHEGNNFLGGNDFDQLMVEELIVPQLEKLGTFEDLLDNLKRASGTYNDLYLKLLHLAESTKIQLSASEVAEVEFDTKDDEGKVIEAVIPVSRVDFERLLQPHIEKTAEMIQAMIDRNSLTPQDIKFVLMVGGSTYIPYVRETVGNSLSIEVNTEVDPTTAVAVGAAFYAGTKPISKGQLDEDGQAPIDADIQIKVAYQKATQTREEYFTALFEGNIEGRFYRIIRADGGFDSGLKPLESQIHEYLPLAPDQYNQFDLKIFDAQNNPIAFDAPAIGITQGRYSVMGQPIPHDICLEIDDVENQQTVLEVVFEKNAILPVRRTIVKQITKTIARGSKDSLTITIVEGPGSALPAANQSIGFISIKGDELTRDLIRGSDVEITLEMSESRDLTINAYLMMTDQEFENVFHPSERHVNVKRLAEEGEALAERVRREIDEAERMDNYEGAQQLVDLEFDILDLVDKAKHLSEDDVTDLKYQLEDNKRKLAQQIDNLTREKYIIRIKQSYFETKRKLEQTIVTYKASDKLQQDYRQLLESEKSILATNSTLRIQEYMDQMTRLNLRIRWQNREYLLELFTGLRYGLYGDYIYPAKAQGFIQDGLKAIEEENDDKLRIAINHLLDLLPPDHKPYLNFGGTGIG
ncbi:Hsp70 family protein [Pontibacter sp. G13]|uniref:Hsp70 family protein n=1 Tax=Pontibacter sp. G13 TaxID=3074898 RepID=UPI00288C35BE|nr:Hsp70 family protein [Pontibacter sp. G13]WNJ18210.1 Hsp70 family protein [Pontibacter sp. G13]